VVGRGLVEVYRTERELQGSVLSGSSRDTHHATRVRMETLFVQKNRNRLVEMRIRIGDAR